METQLRYVALRRIAVDINSIVVSRSSVTSDGSSSCVYLLTLSCAKAVLRNLRGLNDPLLHYTLLYYTLPYSIHLLPTV